MLVSAGGNGPNGEGIPVEADRRRGGLENRMASTGRVCPG